MSFERKNQYNQRRKPQQQRSRATVAAILEASARILRQDGMVGLNTNRIAETAGIGIGSLYGYFPNKEAILLALAKDILSADEAAVLEAVEHCDQPIRSLIEVLVDRHMADRELRRIVMSWHIGAGYAYEHAHRAQSMIKRIAILVREEREGSHDDLTMFVASRAVLGICRALVDEPSLPDRLLLVERTSRLVSLIFDRYSLMNAEYHTGE